MLLLKGKVKSVYDTDNADEVCIEYHDKVTAGNGEKEDYPAGKGSLCALTQSTACSNSLSSSSEDIPIILR